jgi:hypothetical protein
METWRILRGISCLWICCYLVIAVGIGRVWTYEGPPFLVDGDQAERTWAAAHFPPVVLVGLRGTQVAVGGAVRCQLEALLQAVELPSTCQAAHSPPAANSSAIENGTPAPSSCPLFWIRAGRVLVDGRRRLHAALSLLARRRARDGPKVAILPASDLGRRGRRRYDARGARYLILA